MSYLTQFCVQPVAAASTNPRVISSRITGIIGTVVGLAAVGRAAQFAG